MSTQITRSSTPLSKKREDTSEIYSLFQTNMISGSLEAVATYSSLAFLSTFSAPIQTQLLTIPLQATSANSPSVRPIDTARLSPSAHSLPTSRDTSTCLITTTSTQTQSTPTSLIMNQLRDSPTQYKDIPKRLAFLSSTTALPAFLPVR